MLKDNLLEQSQQLKPSFYHAIFWLIWIVFVGILGLYLSAQGNFTYWLVGQCILSVNITQWFVLMHDCGHGGYFPNKTLNTILGKIAGVVCGVPFLSWRLIHNQHHRYTGWQDLDPTTKALSKGAPSGISKSILNLAWIFHIPLTNIIYRYSNFWNIAYFKQWIKNRKQFTVSRNEIIVQLILYIVLWWSLGTQTLIKFLGLSYAIHLMFSELIMVSQHAHIKQNRSYGKCVKTFPFREQAQFTRSLSIPRWIGYLFLLHFEKHEIHHEIPHLAGYHLGALKYQAKNQMGLFSWWFFSKSMLATKLLFSFKQSVPEDTKNCISTDRRSTQESEKC